MQRVGRSPDCILQMERPHGRCEKRAMLSRQSRWRPGSGLRAQIKCVQYAYEGYCLFVQCTVHLRLWSASTINSRHGARAPSHGQDCRVRSNETFNFPMA